MAFTDGYVRMETEQDKEFYNLPRPLTSELPQDLQRLVDRLQEQMATFKPLTGWLTGADDLARAADVLAQVAHEVFKVRLSVEDEDPTHFDAFLNRFVIAADVRPLFDGARVRENYSDAEYEAFAAKIEGSSLPDREALYYFLGAYWGEWLVRHRRATWMMQGPIRPLQAFPDMITSYGTVCLMPFSQVLKKLCDPAGDNLGYKASVFEAEYLPPYPLIASMADRQEAVLSLMPTEARLADTAIKSGDLQGALSLLTAASVREPDNLLVLGQIQLVAWQAEEYEVAHKAMTALLRQHSHARTFYNLGAFYAQLELIDEAIESMRQAILLHPNYGKAKLALAGLLCARGEVELAREILTHLLTEAYDSAIQEEARAYLLELEQDGEV